MDLVVPWLYKVCRGPNAAKLERAQISQGPYHVQKGVPGSQIRNLRVSLFNNLNCIALEPKLDKIQSLKKITGSMLYGTMLL